MRHNRRWVVVHEDDSRPCHHNHRPKDHERCDNAGIHRAEGDEVVAENASAGVEDQDHDGFFGRIEPRRLRDVAPPIRSSSFWGIHGFGHGLAFTDPHDFEFVWGVGFHKEEEPDTSEGIRLWGVGRVG